VITFSLGVQKSRSYESRREQIEAVTKKLSASLQDLSSGVKSAAKKPASLKENAIAKSAVAPALVSNSLRTVHTVQVASFKKKDYAKQEAEWLNSRGYSAMIINGKDYFLVCIGKYASLAEADKALNKIKKEFKQYQDCYVRKL
jgi:septal ring-binding cell division protein DamX